ncbi:Putative ribonuclease H protein At1g65750 [Linum grandiflorum]
MKVGDVVSSKNKPQRAERLVGWKARQDVDVIVNTDGLVLQPSGQAAGGGILRDRMGISKAAFAVNFGSCSITSAELRAALHGLRLAWEMGYRRVSLQVDSLVVLSYLQNTDVADLRHKSCVEDLKELLRRNWTVYVSHTYREGNRVADLLAHQGHSLPLGMHPILLFSTCDIDCIKTDMIGVSFPRSIFINS